MTINRTVLQWLTVSFLLFLGHGLYAADQTEKKKSWWPKFEVYQPPPQTKSTSTLFLSVDPQIIQKLIQLLDERNLSGLETGIGTPVSESIKTLVTPMGFSIKNRYESVGVALSESLGWEQIKNIRVISEQNLKQRLTTVARWDHTPNIRSIALIALASLKDKNDLVYFQEALWSRNIGIRYAAVEALESWGYPESVPVLRELVRKDESHLIRAVAAKALSFMEHPEGIGSLRKLLQDKDWLVRALAAKYLGEVGNHEDYDLLVGRLSREKSLNTNEFVIAEISIAALKLFPQKVEFDRAERERKKREKKKIVSPSQRVVKKKKQPSQGVIFELEPLVVTAPRLKIPQGELVDSRVNFELLKMLRDKENLGLTEEMISQSNTYRDFNELVTPRGIALKTRYNTLGYLLTEGLAGTKDFQLVDQLVRVVREGKTVNDVRSYALIALAYGKDRVHLGLFQEALRDQNFSYRFAAVEALQIWGHQDAISILIGVTKLDTSPIIRVYAAQAVLRLGDPIGKDFLLRSLDHEEWIVRAMAMRYLGELGGGEDYQKLLSYFGSLQPKIVQAEMSSSLLRLYAKRAEERDR